MTNIEKISIKLGLVDLLVVLFVFNVFVSLISGSLSHFALTALMFLLMVVSDNVITNNITLPKIRFGLSHEWKGKYDD